MTEKEKQEMLLNIQGVLERKRFIVVHTLKIPKKNIKNNVDFKKHISYN